MLRQATRAAVSAVAALLARSQGRAELKMRSHYVFEARRPDGSLRWREEAWNTVVNVGLNDVLSQYFKGSGYTASFFVGLKGTGAISANDTMGAHGGWSEITGYSNANRPTLTLGSVASQSVDNSASPAVFNINASVAIFGAFVTTNNTVGGVTGTLYGAVDFTNSRSLFSGDTLTTTITLTAASG